MKNIILLFLVLLLSNITLAQVKNETTNPKGNLYLGAEIGTNAITTFSNNEPNKSLQGGILAEYYFTEQWSVLGKIKYFKTGVSFINSNNYGEFDGAIISIPLNIKWEFRIYKNLKANLKFGGAYNFETTGNYNFSTNIDTNNPKSFGSLNSGVGLNYFISKKIAIYIDIENYKFGGYKGNSQSLFSKNYYTENNLLNFGIKYNLTK